MATATQKDLLSVAQGHDAVLFNRLVRINKAMLQAGEEVVTAPVPTHELSLVEEDTDPFNGNLNNRRVAARIATHAKGRIQLNSASTTHVGDPEKAKADVTKSLKLVPDPVVPSPDVLPPINLAAPTPGSPAAKAAEKAAKKPPSWSDKK